MGNLERALTLGSGCERSAGCALRVLGSLRESERGLIKVNKFRVPNSPRDCSYIPCRAVENERNIISCGEQFESPVDGLC
jgi:hypothetical protein